MPGPKNFVLNADVYCALTFGWHTEPDPDCDCEWKKTKDADDHAIWSCKKCDGKFGVDVWD